MTTTHQPPASPSPIDTGPARRSRSRALAAAAAPAGLALALGLAMPRGPLTSAQSITALALAVVVGLASGWLLRSRWGALVAPATFALVFEITRLGAEGPTVDAIRFDKYGGIIFINNSSLDGIRVFCSIKCRNKWCFECQQEGIL